MKVFFSYRSKNANLVRTVADALTRCGVEVWFAEYEVLPQNYHSFDANLADELSKAVASCTHGLLFTNNDWVDSEPCRNEMAALQQSLPMERILEVQIPPESAPHLAFPFLAGNRPLVWSGDLKALLAQIGRRWNIEVSAFLRDQAPSTGQLHRMPAFGASLELGGFELDETKSHRAAIAYPNYNVAMFSGTVNGIEAGLLFMATPMDSPIGHLSSSSEDKEDDRAIYHRYLRYAAQWEREQGVKIKGCHLFWLGNTTHMALTYITDHADLDQWVWERRYTISLRDQVIQAKGEVNLVFHATLSGPPEQQERIFRSMCAQFERLAQTFRFASPDQSHMAAHASIFCAKSLHLAGGLWLASHALSAEWSSGALNACGALVGVLAADLALFLARPLYRRIIALSVPAAVDLSRGSYEHFSMSLFYWLVSGPFLIMGQVLGAVALVARQRELAVKPSVLFPGLLLLALSVASFYLTGALAVLLASAAAWASFIVMTNSILLEAKRLGGW